MAKTHVIYLLVTNSSGYDMTYSSCTFDSGRLADSWNWLQTIRADGNQYRIAECYEKDWSFAGCSGYVNYTLNSQIVTIGFSNPVMGTNKLGIGTTGKSVYDKMDDHNYATFTVNLTISGETMTATCLCTSGDVNTCTVSISVNPPSEAN